ncbi:MAG: diaminohydroxyphosphoribosylaminopyrimidine deaminase [Gaiellales bacterium]|nr:diaminohydroxyphosphoribosylaminopyrimidine deaminase [Gaiellales bacterium]
MRSARWPPWWPPPAASEPAPVIATDLAHLQRCFELAELGARSAAPNPMVGCVVVRSGRVIGEGWHERPGLPHAEVLALRDAGDAAGATVYVSLEPCAHHGRTPPCADALVAADVARVVVAADDPDPRTNGAGIARMRAAGIEVDVAEDEIRRRARAQNAAFRTLTIAGRPHVTYKVAASLDGRTATAGGESRWISSPQSRGLVHEMRARSAAVAVGIGTALADDPLLTARDCDPPPERQPLRVVFDHDARLPLSSRLVGDVAQAPVAVICRPATAGAAALAAAGVQVIEASSAAEGLAELGRREISSLLVEGGARLAAGLLAEDVIDRLALFTAPLLLGDGPGIIDGWAAERLDAAVRASRVEARTVGPDTLLVADLHEM